MTYEFHMRRMVEEDMGAKLTWLLAAAFFHFEASVMGYALVVIGAMEMIDSLIHYRKARALEKEALDG